MKKTPAPVLVEDLIECRGLFGTCEGNMTWLSPAAIALYRGETMAAQPQPAPAAAVALDHQRRRRNGRVFHV